jgi:uncharacterized protein (TIGR02145 family)
MVVDYNGNIYETVQIGDQLWMAENLRVTKYNNGDGIYTGYSDYEWAQLPNFGARAVYPADNDNASQVTCGNDCNEVYGNLYNWYVAGDDRGVCPEGYHVPSDAEYTVLTDYLGDASVVGGKMKEIGLDHWNSPNAGATNESGFTGLPAGIRYSSGGYGNMGNYGALRTSSELPDNGNIDSDNAYYWFRCQ